MNKEKLTQIIKYLIDKGVTASDFHDVYLNTTTPSEPKKEATPKKMEDLKKPRAKPLTNLLFLSIQQETFVPSLMLSQQS